MTVTYFMLPIPVSHAASGSSGDKADKDKKRPDAPAGNKGQPGANKFQKGFQKVTQKGSKSKRHDPVPQSLKGMPSRTPQGDPICFGTIWALVSREHRVPGNIFVQFLVATKAILKRNINEVVQTLMEFHKGQGNASFKLSTINKPRQVIAWNYLVVQVT